jgi:hypothetical protein
MLDRQQVNNIRKLLLIRPWLDVHHDCTQHKTGLPHHLPKKAAWKQLSLSLAGIWISCSDRAFQSGSGTANLVTDQAKSFKKLGKVRQVNINVTISKERKHQLGIHGYIYKWFHNVARFGQKTKDMTNGGCWASDDCTTSVCAQQSVFR